jgi:hypothetical protein
MPPTELRSDEAGCDDPANHSAGALNQLSDETIQRINAEQMSEQKIEVPDRLIKIHQP